MDMLGRLGTEVPYALLWIGIWGIIENFINKYVKINDWNRKVVIFFFIMIIGLALH